MFFLKTLKTPEDPFSSKSSDAIWFEWVYVRDVAEDPEDFYKLYYSLI